MKNENLYTLDKEQLVKIIMDYSMILNLIGGVCVSVSKCHLEKEEAFRRIREYLCDERNHKLYNMYLGDYINYSLGKISIEELREIVLGVNDGRGED